MDKAKLLLAVAVTLLLAQQAHAVTGVRPRSPIPRSFNFTVTTASGVSSEKLLDAVAGNADAGDRTITLETEGLTEVGLQIDATRDAYTAVTVTATCSYNHGVSYANVNSIEAAGSGSWNVHTATWTKTTSSTTNENLTFGVGLCDHMQFVVGLTTGGASDAFDVYVKGGAL